ncbi:MAG: Hsp20/alpha crystallin family protein [Labilithrix sp.]|nr:Hsp20/alpha crystallin family protein [Labilithrix sp.]
MTAAWSSFPMLDRLLDDVMTGVAGTSLGSASPVRSFSPAMDVRANEDEIVFVADVPGFNREDIEITLDDGTLTIKGQRRYEGNGKDKVWLGRSYGAFTRSFTLPDTADPERLSAELADGVLTVRVAQQPKAKPRRIAITPRQLSHAKDEDGSAK